MAAPPALSTGAALPDSGFRSSLYPLNIVQTASPFLLKNWIKVSLTLEGRDKLTKVLQYAARLIVWALLHNSPDNAGPMPGIAKRFKLLQSNLSQSRKAYRLGRFLGEVEKLRRVGWFAMFALHANRSNNDLDDSTGDENDKTLCQHQQWKTTVGAVKTVSMLLYYAADSLSFLATAGVLGDASNKSHSLSRRRILRPLSPSAIESIQSRATKVSNQTYLVAAIAGFSLNLEALMSYNWNNDTTQTIHYENDTDDDDKDDDDDDEKTKSPSSATTFSQSFRASFQSSFNASEKKQRMLSLAVVKVRYQYAYCPARCLRL